MLNHQNRHPETQKNTNTHTHTNKQTRIRVKSISNKPQDAETRNALLKIRATGSQLERNCEDRRSAKLRSKSLSGTFSTMYRGLKHWRTGRVSLKGSPGFLYSLKGSTRGLLGAFSSTLEWGSEETVLEGAGDLVRRL